MSTVGACRARSQGVLPLVFKISSYLKRPTSIVKAVIVMLDLLPVFFAAGAVVGSGAGASLGALAKAACIRLFRLKGQRLSVSLLLGTTIAESVIMSVSLFLAFIVVEPYATPQLESKAMFFVAFFSRSPTCTKSPVS